MIKNPFAYATLAALYIVFISGIMRTLSEFGHDKPDTIFAPMLLLSLLVLSVAIMAFLFFYQPLRLFIEGKHREAVLFFGKTVGTFSVFVATFLAVVFYTII